MVSAIAHVSVGVANLQPVQTLWIDHFGLQIVAERHGPDPCLGSLWGIPAEQITDQLVLGTPGAKTGYLHFVRFDDPGVPVRQGAGPTDLGPKNIDVNCVDMPTKHADLLAAGYSFRSGISEYQISDIQAREVQMPAHDETNIVLIEVLSAGFEAELSRTGFGAVTSFVVIVPDTKKEADFYHELLGLDEIMHHRIAGPAIEEVIGLPPGAALDMRLIGRDGNLFGRVELIHYEGLSGVNRFPRAIAPATGALNIHFVVPSVPEVVATAERLGLKADVFEHLDLVYGGGPVAVVHSPAGLRVELMESR